MSKELVKTQSGVLVKISQVAKQIASEISSAELANRLAAKVGLTPEESLSLLEDTRLEEAIHDELANKIAAGSIAISAIEALKRKVDEGNMRAIELVLGFNKCLKSQTTKTITNMTINSEQSLIALDASAQKLLGEKKGKD